MKKSDGERERERNSAKRRRRWRLHKNNNRERRNGSARGRAGEMANGIKTTANNACQRFKLSCNNNHVATLACQQWCHSLVMCARNHIRCRPPPSSLSLSLYPLVPLPLFHACHMDRYRFNSTYNKTLRAHTSNVGCSGFFLSFFSAGSDVILLLL